MENIKNSLLGAQQEESEIDYKKNFMQPQFQDPLIKRE